jgi:hypothetical protein
MIYLIIITIIINKFKQLVSNILLLTTMCMHYPQQIHTLHLCRTHVTLNSTYTISRYMLLYWTLFRFRVLTLINSIWLLWISTEYIATEHYLPRRERDGETEEEWDDMGKEKGLEKKGNRTRIYGQGLSCKRTFIVWRKLDQSSYVVVWTL